MSAISDEVRKSFSEGDAKRDKGLTTPENIERYDNILYGTDVNWQILDVYRPKESTGKLPVIISVHGGGWVYGDKDKYQFYCMELASKGFAVINFTYRIAPEFRYPAPVEDTNLVVVWLLKQQEVYGLDVDNVFGIGDSAGAQVLAQYVATCVNPEYANKFSFTSPEKFKFKAIALNCGAYEIEFDEQKDDMMSKLMREYVKKEDWRTARQDMLLMNVISDEFPPVYIMTAIGCFLKNQSIALANELVKKEVPFVLKQYGTKENKLFHVFHLIFYSVEAKKCNTEECDFFRQYL